MSESPLQDMVWERSREGPCSLVSLATVRHKGGRLMKWEEYIHTTVTLIDWMLVLLLIEKALDILEQLRKFF
jgi:hypothetical protein